MSIPLASTNHTTTEQIVMNTTKTDTLTALVENLEIAAGMEYVFVAQGSLIIFINFILVLFIITRKKVRKSHKNCILASLFASHTIIGVLCCSLPYRHGTLANSIIDFGSAAMLASFCNLMLVTLDRFLAIRYPMVYNKITTTSVIVALIMAWFIPIAFLLATLVYRRLTNLAFVLVTSISMLVLLVENSLIFCIVREQCQKIKKVLVRSQDSLDQGRQINRSKRQASHHRAFFICIAMVLSYVVAWMPALIYVLFNALLNKQIANQTFLNFIVFLALCNSLTDPIIYTWFNRKLKTRLKQFVSERRARAMTQLTLMEHSR